MQPAPVDEGTSKERTSHEAPVVPSPSTPVAPVFGAPPSDVKVTAAVPVSPESKDVVVVPPTEPAPTAEPVTAPSFGGQAGEPAPTPRRRK